MANALAHKENINGVTIFYCFYNSRLSIARTLYLQYLYAIFIPKKDMLSYILTNKTAYAFFHTAFF